MQVDAGVTSMQELLATRECSFVYRPAPARVAGLLLVACCLLTGIRIAVADLPDARAQLQEMTDMVLAEIHRRPEQLQDITQLRALAERLILPHIDFTAAAQLVLGKYWRNATDRQRGQFVEQFRALLLNTYLRAISRYHDNAIHFLPQRPAAAADRAEVDAEVEQPGGPPVHVRFRLHRADGDWLVYDFSVEGISLVTTQRSAFAREISEHGLDSLIDRLVKMNARLDTTAAAPANR
jgi:phospholipid transport system substrate-binding protein